MKRSFILPVLMCAIAVAAWVGLRSRAAAPADQAAVEKDGPNQKTVRDFGARGDGRADDTVAIQQAADRGGAVRFPRGTYRITRPIVVDLKRNGRTSVVADGTATLVMAGAGPALHFLGTHAGTADPKSVRDEVWAYERTPMIDGLEIVGDHAEAVGIVVEGTMQPVITRVTVRQALHGVVLTRRNRNVIVSDCHLYHNRGVGLLMERLNLHQVNITNCHISYNAGGGIVVRGSEIRNLQIGSCDIEANMSDDGLPSANFLLDTTNGSVREGAIIGCTLQHSKSPKDGANIRFLGQSAKSPHKVGFFSIADNQISDTGVNIHLQHARGVNITGNTFFLGHQHNLLVEHSSQIVVGPNVFDRNPDYPPGSRDGLVFADCTDCTLTGLHIFNTLADGAALVLRGCRTVNVTGCTILDCDHCGLLLENVEQVQVSGCLVADRRPDRKEKEPVALRLVRGRGNQIVNNLLSGRAEIPPE